MIRACVAALCEGGCWTLLVGGDYNAELSMDDWIVGGRCGGIVGGPKGDIVKSLCMQHNLLASNTWAEFHDQRHSHKTATF